MADKVYYTRELNVQLLSADGSASRIIKIANPTTFPTDGGREIIEKAFAPMLGYATTDTSEAPTTYFFFDDNERDYSTPMVKIGEIEQVTVEKTVRRY